MNKTRARAGAETTDAMPGATSSSKVGSSSAAVVSRTMPTTAARHRPAPTGTWQPAVRVQRQHQVRQRHQTRQPQRRRQPRRPARQRPPRVGHHESERGVVAERGRQRPAGSRRDEQPAQRVTWTQPGEHGPGQRPQPIPTHRSTRHSAPGRSLHERSVGPQRQPDRHRGGGQIHHHRRTPPGRGTSSGQSGMHTVPEGTTSVPTIPGGLPDRDGTPHSCARPPRRGSVHVVGAGRPGRPRNPKKEAQ